MSEKQGWLATYLRTSRKISGKKEQKLRVIVVDLTLFKPDFEELVQLWQNHLQDVEIFIDDQRIEDLTQLAQFAEDYQAKTLRARGHWSERAREQGEGQETRLLVELTINTLIAVLSSWKSLEKSAFIIQLKKLLMRRVTPVQNTIQAFLVVLLLSPTYTVIAIILRQPFNSMPHILRSLLELSAGILAELVFLLLYTRFLIWLKLETRNLLFPGRTTGTRTYQRTAMIIRVLIALVLFILLDGFLVIGSAILAHFWW